MNFYEEPFEWTSELNALLYTSSLITINKLDIDKACFEGIKMYGKNHRRMNRAEYKKFRQEVLEQCARTKKLLASISK